MLNHNGPIASGETALFDYRLVNASHDALKFRAAASFQLPSAHKPQCEHSKNGSHRELLVASPYVERRHLLDLQTLDKPFQLLAKALTVMQPITEAYATASYAESFNWDQVLAMVRTLAAAEQYRWTRQSVYVVVFRSQVPATTNRAELGLLDAHSHVEAIDSGGLLKYWFGVPDQNGRNLATCVWRRRDDAKRGSMGAGHRRAMLATRGMYSEWKLERLSLVIEDDASEWRLTEWEDQA
ncbi:MAG: hypothetical protein M1817_001629 [Caeruleum heppii]|nr:MAG: hypothetical protein M1817_001629 [Caeruleum heppii]